jgi:hypothetical protein
LAINPEPNWALSQGLSPEGRPRTGPKLICNHLNLKIVSSREKFLGRKREHLQDVINKVRAIAARQSIEI